MTIIIAKLLLYTIYITITSILYIYILYDTHTDALRQLHGLPSLNASLSHRAGGQRRQLRLGVVARDGQQQPRRA